MTTIQDIVTYYDGSTASGKIIVTWPPFQYAGVAVAGGQQEYDIALDGSITITCYPCIGAQPQGVYYTATYELDKGAVYDEYWLVPATSPTTIGAIRAQSPATPSIMINAQQLISSGALSGQFLGWSGSNWVPMYVSNFNCAVRSFFGRIGDVMPQTGDYTVAMVTGAVPDTTQIIAGSGLSGGGPLTSNVTISLDENLFVPPTRQVIAGFGLTGGGELTSDVTLAVVPETAVQLVRGSEDGTVAGAEPELNFIASDNMVIDVADNAALNRLDITFVSTGPGGGGTTAIYAVNSEVIGSQPQLNLIAGANITLAGVDDGVDTVNITITGVVPPGYWQPVAGGGIYYNGGPVGIGTSTPVDSLTTSGAIRAFGETTANVASSAVMDYAASGYARLIAFGPNPTTNGGIYFLSIRSDGSNALFAMTVAPSGYVGIGTGANAPAQHLDVNVAPAVGAFDGIRIRTTMANSQAQLVFGNDANQWAAGLVFNGTQSTFYGGANAFVVYQPTDAPIVFVGYGGVEQMRLTPSGNVGIANATPGAQLDVNGIVRSTSPNGVPTGGVGLELMYSTPNGAGVVQAYNRGTSATVPLWVTGNPLALNGGGNLVGVGTLSPQATLDVVGATAPQLRVENLSGPAQIAVVRPVSTTNVHVLFWTATTADYQIGEFGNSILQIRSATVNPAGAVIALDQSTGDVGIGTASPATRLMVAPGAVYTPTPGSSVGSCALLGNDGAWGLFFGGIASGCYWLQAQRNDGSAVAYPIALNPAGGNVGIGTTGPGSVLHVLGPGLGSATGNGVPLLDLQFMSGNNSELKVTAFRNAPGTSWNTATTRIQQLTDSQGQAYIDFNPPNGGTWGMALGTSGGEVLRLLGSYVGILTPSPVGQFSLGNDAQGNLLTYPNCDQAVFYFYQSAANGYARFLDIMAGGSGPGGSIRFLTQNAGAAAATAMFISANGNVGIGTTSPAATLHVVGTAKVGSNAAIATTGDLGVSRDQTPNTGAVYFGNTINSVIYYDGTNFNFLGGSVVSSGSVRAQVTGYYFPDGTLQSTAATGGGLTAYGYPGYAQGTVYQNGYGHAIFELVTINYTGSTNVGYAYADGSNPPTTVLCSFGMAAGNLHSVGFWVLPGQFFRVVATSGSFNVNYWMEWH